MYNINVDTNQFQCPYCVKQILSMDQILFSLLQEHQEVLPPQTTLLKQSHQHQFQQLLVCCQHCVVVLPVLLM